MMAPIDYDLHGLAGIRLLEASAADAAVITRQLGPIQTPLAREPDIFIRFVDRLPTSSRVRYLGLDDVGFTDDAFLVHQSKHRARAKVQIPLDQIGKRCEIVCERGLPEVPLLIPILNLTVLGKGALPLHASAFMHEGTGSVVTGWSKGGKTEALLGFMARGATYIGDEWVYLSRDGQSMYGIPEPIRVWQWHLGCLPQYRDLVGTRNRVKLRSLQLVVNTMSRLTSNGSRHRSTAARTINRVTPLLRKQLCLDVPPHSLFGRDACSLAGTPDRFILVASHETHDVTVRTIDPDEIARRMVFSLQQEQMNFMSYYWKFRFAFPEASNELVENSRALQERALNRVLKNRKAYEVYHPYPVSIGSLVDAIEAHCS